MDSTGLPRALLRTLLCCSSLLGVVSLSYVLGFVALSFSSLSIAPPATVSSHCRIVSSSVDLRFTKVCELGLLNFKAKRVFYPSERRKFQCHYDYYWASVFKVEYFDHLSGEMVLGFAEAPKEALPHDCRPDFGAALLTRHKFKVNESYNCWYSSAMSEIEIFRESNFGCHVKGPSGIELIRRYFILSNSTPCLPFHATSATDDCSTIQVHKDVEVLASNSQTTSHPLVAPSKFSTDGNSAS